MRYVVAVTGKIRGTFSNKNKNKKHGKKDKSKGKNKCEVFSLQPMIPPTKRFDIFHPVWAAQKISMRSDFSFNNNICTRTNARINRYTVGY